MNNDPIPDFILNNQNDYSNGVNTFGWQSSNDPIPDFIKNQEEDIVVSPKRNLKDEEVKTQLGVDFDDSFSSDSKQVKEYVDSLSDDDYELRDQRREEWYSLDARKALMDNRELVNSEPWNLKYKINTTDLWNRALNYIQNLNEWYEKIHPWNKSAQEWLDEATMFMEEKLGKENLMNKRIDKNDPYSKMWPKAAEQTINSYETFVNLVQIPKILGQTLTYSSSKILNIIDQIQSQKAAIPAEMVDLYQKIQWKEPIFNIQYDEERSNPLWSSIQIIKDWLWVWFVIAYPVATYLMSLLGSTNQDIKNVEEKVYNKVEGLFQYLLSLDWAQNLIEIAWLNAKDEESLVEGLTDWLFLIGGALAPKLFRNRTVELHKEAFKQANDFAKKYGKYKTREGFAAKEAAWQLPVWTEILNKKWKPIAVSTPEWGRFTTRWVLETWLQWAKWYAEMFKNYWKWFYQNYNKRNINRNPYAPVWELPNIVGTETQTWNPAKVVEWEKVKEELTPERETEVKEKWFYTDETPIVKTPKKVTPKEGWVSIWEFIKKNINTITGKKWGLSKDLANKLQTSKDLQNEYVNTIDPYIRENWTNNPEWVIQEQLNSLVESVKDKIIERKVNNQIFRRGQKQYKVEITEEEKNNRKIEDEKLKKLLKAMEKQSDSPEELLKYLLNLPKETVEEFNKMIPDFSQNLSLIKDTLDITKAITKPDIVDKFLSFKSEWRLRNKGFLKKLFYSYLKEKYREQGLKANMKELETLINQLSEEELKQRAEAMQAEDWEFPEAVNRSIAQITDFEWPRAWKPYKKLLEQGQENLIPKSAIFDELAYEWYRSVWSRDEFSTDIYLADKNKWSLSDILHSKYSDWTTPLDWIDFYNIGLRWVWYLPPNVWAQHLVNWVIEFRENLSSFNAWILAHEIVHNGLWHLTTKELFDFYNGIVKSTKSLKKYEWDSERDKDIKAISEYMSLDRTRVWIEDYVADSLAQILYKWDLYELDDFLPPDIWSLDLSEKVNKIFSQVAKDLWDTLSAFEIWNGKYSTQAEELKKMLDKIRPSKENRQMSKRRYLEWSPMSHTSKWGIAKVKLDHRLSKLQDVNPELSNLKFDLDLKSDRLGSLIFEMEDWRQLNWDEFKNTLSEEQLKKFNTDPVMWQDEWESSLKEEEQLVQNSIADISPKFSKYSKALNKIDPDIIWLVEKDWQIYVKYLIESQRERYELPDRPWYVEVKEVPAKDYFTEEELNQLPKELKNQILGNEEKDVIQLQKDLDYWHHRAMKAERWSEDPDDYLDLENRKYDENADIEQIQKDIDYRHHRAMVAERWGE